MDIWVPVMVAIVAAIPGLLAYRATRKNEDTDAASKLSDAALELIAPYQARVAEMEAELKLARAFHRRVDEQQVALERRIIGLEQQLQDADKRERVLRAKLDELIFIIRQSGITLPEWAEGE